VRHYSNGLLILPIPNPTAGPQEVTFTFREAGNATSFTSDNLGIFARVRPVPLPAAIKARGRVIDFLPLAEGRRLHPFAFLNAVVDTAGHWIAGYQITQLAPDRFVMELVGNRAVAPGDLATLRSAMARLPIGNVRFDVRHVADIAGDRIGNLHFRRLLVGRTGRSRRSKVVGAPRHDGNMLFA